MNTLTPMRNPFDLSAAPVSNLLNILPDGLGGFIELPISSSDTLDSYDSKGNLRWSKPGPWLSSFQIENGFITYCQPTTTGISISVVVIETGVVIVVNDGEPVSTPQVMSSSWVQPEGEDPPAPRISNVFDFDTTPAFADTVVMSMIGDKVFVKQATGQVAELTVGTTPKYLEGTAKNTCQATYRTPNGNWFGFMSSEIGQTKQGVLGGYNRMSGVGSAISLFPQDKFINASVPLKLFPVQVNDTIVLTQQVRQYYGGYRVFDKTHFDNWIDSFTGGM